MSKDNQIEFGFVINSKDVTTASFSEIRRNDADYEIENTILWENGETTSDIDYTPSNKYYTPQDGIWRVRTKDWRINAGFGLNEFKFETFEKFKYILYNEHIKFEIHIDPHILWLYYEHVNLPLEELCKLGNYSNDHSFYTPLFLDNHATCCIDSQKEIELSHIQSLILLYYIMDLQFNKDYFTDTIDSLKLILENNKNQLSICQSARILLERKLNIVNFLHLLKMEIYKYFKCPNIILQRKPSVYNQ